MLRFKAKPPQGRLAALARLAGVALHPSLSFFMYSRPEELCEEMQVILRWYSHQRRTYNKARVQREDVPERNRPGCVGSCLNASATAVMRNAVRSPMLDTLWNWRNVVARWRQLGIDLPSGTTQVEGGFFALSQAMVLPAQRSLTEERYLRAGRAAMLHLNFHLLHRHHLPSFTEGDARVLHALEDMRLISARRTIADESLMAAAEQRFRALVASL